MGCTDGMRLLFHTTMILVAATATAVEKKVLVIGIDGAGGRYVVEANTPTLDALAASGAARYDFLNEAALVPNPVSGYGASGVNWSTILTGASATHHGVVDNSFAGNDFANHPHFFQHVKGFNSSLSTVSIANWTPINTAITPDAYTDVELSPTSGSAAQRDVKVKDDAVLYLQSGDPDVMFLHFDQVDGAGHSGGWGSPQQLASITTVDSLIGNVMTALNTRPGVVSGDEDWLVLVTADHGGTRGEFGHYAAQGLENWEVPFIISGPSVQPGTQMPQGTLRDVAATALWHLGIDPLVAGLDGTVRGLDYPPIGDLDQDGDLDLDDWARFLDRASVPLTGDRLTDYLLGDLTRDGSRSLSDAVYFRSLFEQSNGVSLDVALHNATPEPTAIALLAFSLLACSLQSRRNRDL